MRIRLLLIAAAAAAAPACKRNHPIRSSAAAATRDAARARVATAKASAPPAGAPEGPIHWIDDDYQAALARARAAHKPIVIDMWAHWCHSCLSMQNTVLKDPGLKPLAGRFVWVAIDTDNAKNAAAVAKFPVRAWPTYYVISPEGQKVEARHIGSASVAGFRAFLERGERGYADDLAVSGKLASGSPLALARKGDRASTRGDFAAADKAYAAALAAAPAKWARRPEVLVSRISALEQLKRWKECAALARSSLADTGESNSAADFASFAADCASHLEDAAQAGRLRRAAVARISAVLASSHSLSVDDRADALHIERDIDDKLGEHKLAHRLAREEKALLDKAAASAPTAYVANTYNWPRADVDVYLHEEKQLVPDLKESVAALPHQFDPPYRLAWVYYKLGEQDKAAKMIDRAASLAYGPRKVTVLRLAVKIDEASGDARAEKKALTALIATCKSLPDKQRRPGTEKKAQAALARLETGKAASRGAPAGRR